MALLKKKKKKPMMARFASGGGSGSEVSPLRPVYVEKRPPCTGNCPSGNDIRGWLKAIAEREKAGISLEQACDDAWLIEVETNPFPAVMGRVCPHPCEAHCNRNEKDGAVAINSVERFIGDWGLKRGLKLPKVEGEGPYEERIAIVGAGPCGLSAAYQLVRRGYSVDVFESLPKPGGMLRYGIPEYRLPREVLDAEIQRILDMGVNLKCGVVVGRDIDFEKLLSDYDAVFVAIGAHKGRKMGIPGEDGEGVWTGTEFLNLVNSGERPDVGKKIVVVGGGDTAIDAARVSLRIAGPDAQVTILYRRTRTEMPAIDREVDEALEEGIKIEFLAAPIEVLRSDGGKVKGLVVQRMELGEPDESGRRRPVPIEGDTYQVECDSVIMAVSQVPDWDPFGGKIAVDGSWLSADKWGRTSQDKVWAGGDVLGLGLATTAIGHGRKAAIAIHHALRGLGEPSEDERPPIGPDKIKLDWYQPKERAQRKILSAEERLANPFAESDLGISDEEAIEEASRCFSCGLCFACENCWMYCQNNCFKKLPDPKPGRYYTIDISTCDGCKKCWEECPCGYIEGQ